MGLHLSGSTADAGAAHVRPGQAGVLGNNTGDDTAAVQATLNTVSPALGLTTVVVHAGTYRVNGVNTAASSSRHQDWWQGGGLKPKSGTRLVLLPGAVLQVIGNTSPAYSAVYMDSTQTNITITGGGEIRGERDVHDYTTDVGSSTTHEFGYGVGLRGASNITIDGITITKCTGDSVFAGAVGTIPGGDYIPVTNVAVRNCTLDGARRNNISVEACDGFVIENNRITRAGYNDGNHDGTAPRVGIDLEGYGVGSVDYQTVLNTTVRGNILVGNVNGSVLNFDGYGATIEGNFADTNIGFGAGTTTVVRGNVLVSTSTTASAITSNAGISYRASSVIEGNIIVGFGNGITVQRDGVAVRGNYVHGYALVGIDVEPCTDVSITGNHITEGVAGSTDLAAIKLNGCTDVTIDSNHIRNTRKALRLQTACTGVIFSNNKVRRAYLGVEANNASQVDILDNYFNLPGWSEGQTSDIGYSNGTAQVLVKGNQFVGSTAATLLAVNATGGRSRFIGNEIIDSTAATAVSGSGGTHSIIGNTIISNRPSGSPSYAIVIFGSAANSRVLHNIVYHVGAVAYSVLVNSSAATLTTVMGNSFAGATFATSNASDFIGGNNSIGIAPTVNPGSTPDPGGQIVRSGFAVGVQGTATSALGTGTMVLRPVRIQKGGTILTAKVNVTAVAATAVMRIGVYDHDTTTGFPKNLIQEFTSSATIDASGSTGARTVTLPSSLVLLDNTVYWLAAVAQTASPTVSATDQGDSLLPSGLSSNTASLTYPSVTGALPSLLTAASLGSTTRMANMQLLP